MCPVLLKLGPWPPAALPVIFVVLFALMLVWQWAERRYGGGKPLTALRVATAAVPAALLTALLYWGINRVAPLEIKAWGTMLVVAFTAGAAFLARYGNRKVVTPAEALDVALYALIGAVIGSRVIFVILDWPLYAGHPAKIFNVWEGGLSFHGGLLGAVVAAIIYARLKRKSFWAIADETAPSIAIGYAFARIGCFLNGCCHGHASDLPWAMDFPHGELPGQAVHPTQLYAFAASVAIAVLLIKLRGRFPRDGHLFTFYLAVYSVARFLLEYTRAGATGKLLSWLPSMTVGQLASILIFLVAMGGIVLTWPRGKSTPAPPAAAETRHGPGKRR